MPDASGAGGDVTLACKPGKQGDDLVFDVTVANDGAAAVFVMDAMPTVDPTSGRAAIDADAVSVWIGDDGIATILRGLPPAPDRLDADARVTPLAIRLAPGARVARRIVQKTPLAEHSVYVPPGFLRDYRLVPIAGIAIAVDVVSAGAPGVIAVKAVGYPAGLFRLVTDERPLRVRQLRCEFRTRGLHALRHAGAYPRPDGP